MARSWTSAVGAGIVVAGLVGVAVMVAVARGARPSPEASPITVGPNVQVSRDLGELAHGEVIIGADPRDSTRLIACSMVFSATRTGNPEEVVAYVSADRGATWSRGMVSERNNDPSCLFGLEGEAYLQGYGQPSGTLTSPLYRSMDGGRTWEAPVHLPPMDRPYVAVDLGDGARRGHVYVAGTQFEPHGIGLFRSTDQGRTFAGPARVVADSGASLAGVVPMGPPVVLSDGTLVLLAGRWSEDPSGGEADHGLESSRRDWRAQRGVLRAFASTDGGATVREVGTLGAVYTPWPPFSNSSGAELAVDRSAGPFRDRIHAAWADARTGRTQILAAYSDDAGRTWSLPVAVDDVPPTAVAEDGPDNFMPAIAVNRAGVVGVSWYDRRDNPDGYGWWVRFTASRDGGVTWLPSVRASSAANAYTAESRLAPVNTVSTGGGGFAVPGLFPPSELELRMDMGWGFLLSGGHTAGLAADAAGDFHPLWIDNRTRLPQVWTARVRVAGEAVRHGDAALAALHDVTPCVTATFATADFDKRSGEGAFDVRLQNTGAQPVAGPLKLRVVRLRSDFGVPSLVTAEGERGVGAVLDFTPLLPGGRLAPGDTTRTMHVPVRLRDVVRYPDPANRRVRHTIASLGTHALAGAACAD